MKKFLVLLISLVMPFALFGQTYSALWKKVEEAGEKDLPMTRRTRQCPGDGIHRP